MTDTIHNVLFICTGNSARSVIAEGLLNQLGGDRFKAFSAGSHPKGEVHPLALATLRSMHIADAGYRSKSWGEFAKADVAAMDFVITVCDQAAGEVCPVWPGQPITAHWGPAGSRSSRRHRGREKACLHGHRRDAQAPHRVHVVPADGEAGAHGDPA